MAAPQCSYIDRQVSLQTPAYFVALDFDRDHVLSIHDFLYARYAIDGLDITVDNLAVNNLTVNDGS